MRWWRGFRVGFSLAHNTRKRFTGEPNGVASGIHVKRHGFLWSRAERERHGVITPRGERDGDLTVVVAEEAGGGASGGGFEKVVDGVELGIR